MKLTEVELLKLQNVNLRLELVTRERDALTKEFILKYGEPGDKGIQVEPDGTVTRVPPQETGVTLDK